MEPSFPDTHLKKLESRPSTIRYMGFENTDEGRSYHLRVDGAGEPRFVTVAIPNEAFASHRARFQDAPELCVARVRRELAASPDLPDGVELLVTTADLDEHHDAQLRRSPERKRRTPHDGA